jgi:hypothetical protein
MVDGREHRDAGLEWRTALWSTRGVVQGPSVEGDRKIRRSVGRWQVLEGMDGSLVLRLRRGADHEMERISLARSKL